MKLVIDILEERISAAMAAVAGVEGCAAIVRPAADAKFGDYQANGVMALAKKVKANPRKLAGEVVAKLDLSDICEPPEVAGPGFINLRLKADFLADRLLEINEDTAGLAVDKAERPKTIVVDFSSPNIAKQMHVGHLRSTILGDAICRMLEFLSHKVIRQNHIGDWGLQMGMMLHDMNTGNDDDLVALENHYVAISDQLVANKDIAQSVHESTARLQRGRQEERQRWQHVRSVTLKSCFEIYDMLGRVFAEEDVRGESFYESMLPGVVGELKKQGIAVESDRAVCVFPPGFKNKDGKALPFIIQKSDGAYLYATTDLAALRYRVNELKADAIVYVTDARQKLHFEMLFAVARMAGWDTRQKTGDRRQETELVHVMFGSILGDDGTPLKTRAILFNDPLEITLVANPKPVTLPGMVIERRLIQHLGGFDETLRWASDRRFILRLAAQVPFAYIDRKAVIVDRVPGQVRLTEGRDAEAKKIVNSSHVLNYSEVYFRCRRQDKRIIRKARRELGRYLSNLAAACCGEKDMYNARRFALDGLYFGGSWRTYRRCIAVLLCPWLVRRLVAQI